MRLHTEVHHEFTQDADTVWKITGDFGGLKNWLPGIVASRVEGSGAIDQGGNAVRIIDIMDGSVTRESLASFNDAKRTYTYNLLEAKGIDASAEYQATFTVTPTPTGCRVDWVSAFSVPDSFPPEKAERAKQRIRQMYSMCLQHLEGLLAKN